MVNIKKIQWIPVLMIISQLMLTGFVAYWLKSQYDEEKKLLRDELSRIYDESRNQVIDSLLFNRVVEPALKDSVTITMMANNRIDTANHKVIRTFDQANLRVNNDSRKTAIMAISIPDSIRNPKTAMDAAYAFSRKKQDFLIRSVKLFINHTGDTLSSQGALPAFLPGTPDTGLFRKIYREKLAQKKYGVHVVWVKDSGKGGEDVKDVKGVKGVPDVKIVKRGENDKNIEAVKIGAMVGSGGMFFRNVFPNDLPGVQIKNDFPYLIRRISPQILFALILLLLTGSAFFFTNRSLNRQLMLNSLRNDFVSNITHELRTPVSTVKVALEALKTFDKVNNPAITLDYLDMATQEMNRLDQLIGKVLDQSLIGDQNHLIQPQPSDLKELIDKTLVTLEPRLIARKASINFDSSEHIDIIMVDPLYFQGILINLIDNSLKYGNEAPEITIRLRQDKSSAVMEVGDNGPGIPKEYLGKVFDKFFRVPAGDTHNIKGYGLGLSFAALVMNQHQGSIAVKNQDKGGCLFTLTFPLKKA